MEILKPSLQADQVIRARRAELEQALDALGPAGIKERVSKGVAPSAAAEQSRERVKAAAAQRVRNSGRQTVMRSAAADPRATGWRRVSRGGCKFCQMLAGRDAVYGAESVRFASHDHCRCQAVPAYGGKPVDVHQYTASKAKITEAERRQLKDYLAGVQDDGVTPVEPAPQPDDNKAAATGEETPSGQQPTQVGPGTRAGRPPESEEQRWERQQRLKSDTRALEARDGMDREVLESHEIDFLERFEARGERVQWIRRDRAGGKPTNDFTWTTNGSQACELNSTSDKYSTISRRIRTATVKAAEQGVTKDVFIVDLGPRRMPDKLRHQLERYNANHESGRIRSLYVMHDDGAAFEEINLDK